MGTEGVEVEAVTRAAATVDAHPPHTTARDLVDTRALDPDLILQAVSIHQITGLTDTKRHFVYCLVSISLDNWRMILSYC